MAGFYHVSLSVETMISPHRLIAAPMPLHTCTSIFARRTPLGGRVLTLRDLDVIDAALLQHAPHHVFGLRVATWFNLGKTFQIQLA